MNKKQMQKIADELAQLELIHRNSSSKEERKQAENRIMAITAKIMQEHDGLINMIKIDELIQQKLQIQKGE